MFWEITEGGRLEFRIVVTCVYLNALKETRNIYFCLDLKNQALHGPTPISPNNYKITPKQLRLIANLQYKRSPKVLFERIACFHSYLSVISSQT